MYFVNAYGHWLVEAAIKPGELVIRCTSQGEGKPVKKEIVKFEKQ